MKTNPPNAGRIVLALAALTGTARLAAQALPAAVSAAPLADAAPAPEVRYEVQSSRTVPLPEGRNLIIQRVSPPVLPPLPALPVRVLPPPLTPEQLAAHRAARPRPMETRLLSLMVTHYAENLSYIEWWPQAGGEPYGAWSNADYEALRMVPEMEVTPGEIRWLIFPYIINNRILRPGTGPLALPQLPADGPGFLLVKGNPADRDNINPVAALHKIYKEEGAELKRVWAERERVRLEEEAWRAANPPPPPGDAVIRFWIIENPAQETQPCNPSQK